MEITDFAKTIEMGKRIYNNKMINDVEKGISDEKVITQMAKATFNNDGEVSSLENIRSLNKLIVEVAEEETQPQVEKLLKLISDYKKVGMYDTVRYDIEKQARISMALSATATGVDFSRISPNRTSIPARPENHQIGSYYNIDKMISDPVNEFRRAVDMVKQQRVQYIFKQIMKATRQAIKLNTIPSSQIHDSANITLTQFRQIENNLLRYGRGVRPLLIADMNFIDYLAMKQGIQGVDESKNLFLTDDLRESLLRDINIEEISRSIAVATDNPFVDNKNSKVDLPVDEAIIIAGGKKSPFRITEFGKMRTLDMAPSIEDEKVFIKIDYKLDVTLLTGQAMAYVHDTNVKL